MQQLWLGARFFGDLQHCVDEAIERFNAFGLSRLDHESFMDDQREVVCGWMEIVVHQPLGDIQGVDVGYVLPVALEHELMHARAVVG